MATFHVLRFTFYGSPFTCHNARLMNRERRVAVTGIGGRWPSSTNSSVTDVRWLPPTQANIAKARVTIPAGFHRVSSPADQ